MHHLAEMRRADLLLSFRHQHDIHRRLTARGFERVECGKPGRLRSLLIDGTASDQDFTEGRPVDDGRGEGRRAPLRRIELFYVIHEIHADGALRTSVQSGKHPRLTVGGHDGRTLETRLFQEVGHHLRALPHVAVLCRNGGQSDPILEALDGFGSLLFDRGTDGGQVSTQFRVCLVSRRQEQPWSRQGCTGGRGHE
ncbi:MAG TPA: hypothetical protein VGC34_07470 [Steroidobacteraceae bacterium]